MRARSRSGPHVESRIRVRYKDTDQMGIAHHSNYLVWFEIGRTDLCRAVGLTYREIEQRGFILVVTQIECRYRMPYRYDDEVVIRTSISEAGSRAFRFSYELVDAAGSVVHANGASSHFWVDRESRRPVIAPDEMVEAFGPYLPGRQSH